MEGAGSLTLKRLQMQTGAVPHMTVQAVAREAGGQPSDQRIPLLPAPSASFRVKWSQNASYKQFIF